MRESIFKGKPTENMNVIELLLEALMKLRRSSCHLLPAALLPQRVQALLVFLSVCLVVWNQSYVGTDSGRCYLCQGRAN